ncbi:MAG: SOS response-associated peptidase [Steroidobacteraceae bacterium]
MTGRGPIRYSAHMCGRYILAQQAKFERAVQLGRVHWEFPARYNVAPSQPVPVVRSDAGVHEGVMMRWGLIPYFARGVAPKYSTINATVEKLTTSPVWRGPWTRGQRCIQLAAGFYEWRLEDDGRKQPYFIHLTDAPVFGFASVWDASIAADGATIESCAVITLPGNALLRHIHNSASHPGRMPAILAPEQFEAWLSGAPQTALTMLQPYSSERMAAYPVSLKVNSPRNDGSELIEPLRA